MRGLARPLLLAAAVLFVPGAVYAQVGAIAGTVRDASGAVMPGVTVEATSPALIEKVRSSITDDSGRYQITVLPVGTYKVTFALQGFSTVERDDVIADLRLHGERQRAARRGQHHRDRERRGRIAGRGRSERARAVRLQGRRHRQPPDRARPGRPAEPGARRSRRTRARAPAASGPSVTASPPPSTRTSPPNDADGQNQGRIVVDGMTINRGAAPQGINLNTGATNGIAFDTANVQELTFTLSGALGESETGGASITIVPRTGGNRFAGSYFTSYTNDNFFDRNREHAAVEYAGHAGPGQRLRRERRRSAAPSSGIDSGSSCKARTRGDEKYPNGGTVGGFANLNEGKFAAQLPAAARRWHQGLLAHVHQRAEERRRAAHAAGLPEKQVQPLLGRAGRVHEPLQGHDQHRRFSRELLLAAEPAEPPAVRLVDEPVHEQDPVRGRHHRREHDAGLDPPPRVPEPPRASAHLRSRVRQPAWTRRRRR